MRITILGDPAEYKGFHILVQNIGNIFQAIIFNPKDKTFRQLYNEISNSAGKKHNTETLRKAYAWTMQQAIATCEVIINKDNPDKLLKGKEGAAEIVRILDSAEKVNVADAKKREEANKTPVSQS